MDRTERFYQVNQLSEERLSEERRAVRIAMRLGPLGGSRSGLVVAGEFDREAG